MEMQKGTDMKRIRILTPSQREAARRRARAQAARDPGRVRLGAIDDDYALGVIAAKCGLTAHIDQYMPRMRKDAERARLYEAGRRDADAYCLNDIADQLWTVRTKSPRAFDEAIARSNPRDAEAIIAAATRGQVPDPHVECVRREALSLLEDIAPKYHIEQEHMGAKTPRYGCAGV